MIEIKSENFSFRQDGRMNFELRNVNFKLNIIPSSISSFYIEFGVHKILLALFGPIFEMKKNNDSSDFVKTILFESFEKLTNLGSSEKDVFIVNSILEKLILTRLFQGSKFYVLIRKLKGGYNFNGFLTWASQILFVLSDIPFKIKVVFNNLGIVGKNILVDLTLEELFFTKIYLEIISEEDYEYKILKLNSSNLKDFTDLERYLGFTGNNFFKIIFLKICPNKYNFSVS